jgi:hypothetical protein
VVTAKYFYIVFLILFIFCAWIKTECESLSGKCVPELVGFSKGTCHRMLVNSDIELCDGCKKEILHLAFE